MKREKALDEAGERGLLPFEGDTNKGALVIRILRLVAKGIKLVPEELQELKLIGKNDRLNVSSRKKNNYCFEA